MTANESEPRASPPAELVVESIDKWFRTDRTTTHAVEDISFRVAGGEEFAEMQHQLTEAGIEYRLGSPEEAIERRVLEVLKLSDPSGNPIEIFHGPEVQFSRPFHPGEAAEAAEAAGADGCSAGDGGALPSHFPSAFSLSLRPVSGKPSADALCAWASACG